MHSCVHYFDITAGKCEANFKLSVMVKVLNLDILFSGKNPGPDAFAPLAAPPGAGPAFGVQMINRMASLPQVQQRHGVHGRTQAQLLLADNVAANQPGDSLHHLLFLPGDLDPRGTHLLDMGP